MHNFSRTYDHIFWDWHGVLGTKGFWYISAKQNPEIQKVADYIFADPDQVKAWMRSETSLRALLQESRAAVSYETLVQKFAEDWSTMDAINVALIDVIKARFPTTPRSIITDNMEIFNQYTASNEFLQQNFQHIFNSGNSGVLKTDSPGLFEYVLEKLQLPSFHNTLFLDDSPANCARFEKLGGTAILVENGSI